MTPQPWLRNTLLLVLVTAMAGACGGSDGPTDRVTKEDLSRIGRSVGNDKLETIEKVARRVVPKATITYDDYAAEVRADKPATNAKYDGSIVQLSGKVYEAGPNKRSGTLEVTMVARGVLRDFEFAAKHSAAIAALKPTDPIAVRCLSTSIGFRGCYLPTK